MYYFSAYALRPDWFANHVLYRVDDQPRLLNAWLHSFLQYDPRTMCAGTLLTQLCQAAQNQLPCVFPFWFRSPTESASSCPSETCFLQEYSDNAATAVASNLAVCFFSCLVLSLPTTTRIDPFRDLVEKEWSQLPFFTNFASERFETMVRILQKSTTFACSSSALFPKMDVTDYFPDRSESTSTLSCKSSHDFFHKHLPDPLPLPHTSVRESTQRPGGGLKISEFAAFIDKYWLPALHHRVCIGYMRHRQSRNHGDATTTDDPIPQELNELLARKVFIYADPKFVEQLVMFLWFALPHQVSFRSFCLLVLEKSATYHHPTLVNWVIAAVGGGGDLHFGELAPYFGFRLSDLHAVISFCRQQQQLSDSVGDVHWARCVYALLSTYYKSEEYAKQLRDHISMEMHRGVVVNAHPTLSSPDWIVLEIRRAALAWSPTISGEDDEERSEFGHHPLWDPPGVQWQQLIFNFTAAANDFPLFTSLLPLLDAQPLFFTHRKHVLGGVLFFSTYWPRKCWEPYLMRVAKVFDDASLQVPDRAKNQFHDLLERSLRAETILLPGTNHESNFLSRHVMNALHVSMRLQGRRFTLHDAITFFQNSERDQDYVSNRSVGRFHVQQLCIFKVAADYGLLDWSSESMDEFVQLMLFMNRPRENDPRFVHEHFVIQLLMLLVLVDSLPVAAATALVREEEQKMWYKCRDRGFAAEVITRILLTV